MADPARDRGFTLLEVLVAFTMLAVVLGAAYAAISGGLAGAARGEVALSGLAAAESALARAGADIPLAPGSHKIDAGGWRVTLAIAEDMPGDRVTWVRLGLRPWRVTATARAPGAAPVSVATVRMAP